MMDMTDNERGIIQQLVQYWAQLLQNGTAIAYGPVLDPKGGYSVGFVCVDTNEEFQQIMKEDPANGLNKYEFAPMKAIYRNT